MASNICQSVTSALSHPPQKVSAGVSTLREATPATANGESPVDVTLDGTSRQADVNMEDIAWTYTDAYGTSTDPNNYDDLELQITSSATAYENCTSYGYIDISSVQVTLPTANPAEVDPRDWTPD